MAKYTTELRTLVEINYDLGLDDYPIFDEAYRTVLNKKIIDHYMFREIGLETPGLFRHFLKTRMSEIMPYYNKLYNSELLPLDPFISYDLTEVMNKVQGGKTKSKGVTKSQGSGTSQTQDAVTRTDSQTGEDDNLGVHSDTSAGNLAVNDLKNNVHASTADRALNKQKQDSNSQTASSQAVSTTGINDTELENDTEVKSLEDYTIRRFGAIGVKTLSAMLDEFRATFLNIDKLIIIELNDLFMGIY